MQLRKGSKLLVRGRERTVASFDFYTYVARVTDLTPGATLVDNVKIEADADFYAFKFMQTATSSNSLVTPLARIQLIDQASGRNLQDEPVDISSIGGTGELPFILETPRHFSANGTVQVQFNNYSGTATYDQVSFYFNGYKVWFAD